MFLRAWSTNRGKPRFSKGKRARTVFDFDYDHELSEKSQWEPKGRFPIYDISQDRKTGPMMDADLVIFDAKTFFFSFDKM